MSDLKLEIDVVGLPATKGSWIAMANGRVRPASGRKLGAWQKALRYELARCVVAPIAAHVPVAVEVTFRFARPQSHSGTRGLTVTGRRFPAPTSRAIGDGDKLERAVWDELSGCVFADDSQVVHWSGMKRWCFAGEEPGCTIVVSELGPMDVHQRALASALDRVVGILASLDEADEVLP